MQPPASSAIEPAGDGSEDSEGARQSAPVAHGAYYPEPADPGTAALAHTLNRAAQVAGDDPDRYSFARIRTDRVTALRGVDTLFYFSDGLAALPPTQRDALIAQAVAHAALGHDGESHALSLSVSAAFTAFGFVAPGVGIADFVVTPIVVRTFTREQHLAADRRAIDILKKMGHATPRRALGMVIRIAAAVNGPPEPGILITEPEPAERLAALEALEPLSGEAPVSAGRPAARRAAGTPPRRASRA